MYLTIFLIFLNLFKVLIARYFPLIGDEAYYWLWSRHLDLCYVDHPPLIAYVNFILTSLFGNSELAIRLAAILIVLLISWIIYLTGKELYDPRAAALAVIIFNLLPTFFAGGMFLVPQILLFLFWSLSFYFFVKIIKTKEAKYWYWLGIAVGAGILSDYIMPLFIMGTAIFLLFSRENRFWFFRKEPYLALILALAVCSPIIIWNLKYASVGLATLGGRPVSFGRIGSNLLNFAGLQMILYTPVIFIMTLYLIFRDPGRNLALKVFSAVVFIPFALISPILNIGGHWPATAYLPAILNSHRAKKISIGLILFFALLVNSLGFAYYLFLYPTPDELKGQEFRTNAELPQFLKDASPKSGKTYYYANDLGMMGLVSFHGKVAVYMAAGRLKQADIWGRPAVQKGDNAIYFALNETPLYEKLEPMFVKVSIDPKKRIFAKDADIPTKTQIFICAGFKGGTLP
jgi:4-amino-4-deoxy-L-arabinose transferase-like glycosyltransferase